MNSHDFRLGPEPKWLDCKCGRQSMRVPCWECNIEQERKANASRRRSDLLLSVPRRYRWAAVDAPELAERVGWQGDLKSLAERILGATRVLFVGGSGAGKTSLAAACLQHTTLGGWFCEATGLGVARQQAKFGDGEASFVSKAMWEHLVVIDDVGQESRTANSNVVREVVFARYDSELPTWITTGLTSAQILDAYGDGFLRRCTEDALVVRLEKRA